MKTNYIRQIVYDMRHHPMVTWVNIVGTAVAIFLLMVVVEINAVKTEPFRPESNRDRMLHMSSLMVCKENSKNYSMMSYKTGERLFSDIPEIEATAMYCSYLSNMGASLPKQRPSAVEVRVVNDEYFKVFDFKYLEGKPFDKSAMDTSEKTVVISETVARRLFGTVDVVGKQMLLDFSPATIAGVVEDVSSFASNTYADVWMALERNNDNVHSYILGNYKATILAKSRGDFASIRAEVKRRLSTIETELKDVGVTAIEEFNQPFDQETASVTLRPWDCDIEHARLQRLMLYIILLIVPAMNIASMTNSRMRQRLTEIAVKRSYGCKKGHLMLSLVVENMIVTLIAGFIGLVAAIVFGLLSPEFFYNHTSWNAYRVPTVSLAILFHWSTFFMALLFCFMLNLLSTGVPAWMASRVDIVNSLRGKN